MGRETQTNFTADQFGAGSRKSGQKAGRPNKNGAENYQPESALNQADYYDETTDSGVKFRSGADNEFGGNLVEDPRDALNGGEFSDVKGPGPDHMVTADENINQKHTTATVEQPMGNTEDAETKSASGVTANRADKKTAKDPAKKSAAQKKVDAEAEVAESPAKSAEAGKKTEAKKK
jgi:hypothetical protein